MLLKWRLLWLMLMLVHMGLGRRESSKSPAYDFMEDLGYEVVIHWSVLDDELLFEISAPTTGWIGVGFSDSGTMENADIIIAGVKDDNPYIIDAHSERNGSPVKDRSVDVDWFDYTEQDSVTTLTISRLLNTGDRNDFRIRGGEINVIWAYGERDLDGDITPRDYHQRNRGTKRVKFLDEQSGGSDRDRDRDDGTDRENNNDRGEQSDKDDDDRRDDRSNEDNDRLNNRNNDDDDDNNDRRNRDDEDDRSNNNRDDDRNNDNRENDDDDDDKDGRNRDDDDNDDWRNRDDNDDQINDNRDNDDDDDSRNRDQDDDDDRKNNNGDDNDDRNDNKKDGDDDWRNKDDDDDQINDNRDNDDDDDWRNGDQDDDDDWRNNNGDDNDDRNDKKDDDDDDDDDWRNRDDDDDRNNNNRDDDDRKNNNGDDDDDWRNRDQGDDDDWRNNNRDDNDDRNDKKDDDDDDDDWRNRDDDDDRNNNNRDDEDDDDDDWRNRDDDDDRNNNNRDDEDDDDDDWRNRDDDDDQKNNNKGDDDDDWRDELKDEDDDDDWREKLTEDDRKNNNRDDDDDDWRNKNDEDSRNRNDDDDRKNNNRDDDDDDDWRNKDDDDDDSRNRDLDDDDDWRNNNRNDDDDDDWRNRDDDRKNNNRDDDDDDDWRNKDGDDDDDWRNRDDDRKNNNRDDNDDDDWRNKDDDDDDDWRNRDDENDDDWRNRDDDDDRKNNNRDDDDDDDDDDQWNRNGDDEDDDWRSKNDDDDDEWFSNRDDSNGGSNNKRNSRDRTNPRQNRDNSDRSPRQRPGRVEEEDEVDLEIHEGKGEEFLNYENTVYLQWIYDQEAILFKLTAPTRGWIGVGFSKTKSMVNSDLLMLGVHRGRGYVIDLNSNRNGVPRIDRHQDVTLLSATENSTHTVVAFRRARKTVDDMEIVEGPINVIWAYGSRDLTSLPGVTDYHGMQNRGWTRIEFIKKILKWGKGSQRTIEKKNPGNDYDYSDRRDVFSRPRPKTQKFNLNLPLNVTLDEDRGVELSWIYDKTHIIMKLSAPTLGWIGIGFSDRRSMMDSDLHILGVSDVGLPYAIDAFGLANGKLMRDQKKSLIILQSSENDTHTSMIITRKRDTADQDDYKIEDKEINVLWAYSRFDILDEISSAEYHFNNRGIKRMNLIQPIPEGSVYEIEDEPEEEEPNDFDDDPSNDDPSKSTVIFLDDDEKVQLRYNNVGDNIVLQLTAPTRGWVGLGFSKDGTMENADVIMTGIDGGKRYLHDAHSDRNGSPDLDDTNDVTILMIRETGEQTAAAFRRKHDTGDSEDFKIGAGKINVIWAYGDDDMSKGPDQTFYHFDNRGSKEIVLRPGFVDKDNNGDSDQDKFAPVVRNGDGTYSTFLDEDETFFLNWKVTGNNIAFMMSSKSFGWVGLGFSPGVTMKGADIIMAGVDQGDNYVFDTHATDNKAPERDASQDIDLKSVTENDTHTTVTFERPLNTRDDDDFVIKKGVLNVLWASGEYDLLEDITSFDYHEKSRGVRKLELIREEEVTDDNTGGGVAATTQSPVTLPGTTTATGQTESPDDNSVGLDDNVLYLDDERTVQMSWTIRETLLIINMVAPTTGWIGIGFSDTSSMKNADFIIGGESDDQKDYIFDAYFDGAENLSLDDFQDVKLLAAAQMGNVMSITITKPIDFTDEEDKPILEGRMNVIWGYGDEDMTEDKIPSIKFKRKGSKVVEFIPGDDDGRIPDETAETTTQSTVSATLATSVSTATTITLPNSRSVDLDSDGLVSFNSEDRGGKILIEVTAPTTGWVGIGFSEDGNKRGADFIISGSKGGRDYIFDAHFDGNGQPVEDSSQDATLIAVFEADTSTNVLFEVSVDVSDINDVPLKRLMYVHWAYGKDDWESFNEYNPVTEGTERVLINPNFKEGKRVDFVATTTSSPFEIPETTTPLDYYGDYEEYDNNVGDNGGSPAQGPPKPTTAFLDDDQTASLQWIVTPATIVMQYTGPAFGWFGIGFSPNGDLEGSDFIVLGDRYAYDAHISQGKVILDESQDIRLMLFRKENETHATVLFSKMVAVSDSNDVEIKSGITIVLWSLGKESMPGGFDPDKIDLQDIKSKSLEMIPGDSSRKESTTPLVVTTIPNAITTSTVFDQVTSPAATSTTTPTTTTPTTTAAPTTASTMPSTTTTTTTISTTTTIVPTTLTTSTSETTVRTTTEITTPEPTTSETSTIDDPLRRNLFPSDTTTTPTTMTSQRTFSTTNQPVTTAQLIDTERPNSEFLDRQKRVITRWRIDGNFIIIEVTAPTLGWVGIGFSKDGTMKGADMIIGGVRGPSTYSFDTHSVRNGAPQIDDVQDTVLIDAFENGTHTVVVHSRLLDTDDKQDIPILGGEMMVIWAYGSNDMDEKPTNRDYHLRNRGSKSIDMLQDVPDSWSTTPTSTVTTRSTRTTLLSQNTETAKVTTKDSISALVSSSRTTTSLKPMTGTTESQNRFERTTAIPISAVTPLKSSRNVSPMSVVLEDTITMQWSVNDGYITIQVVAPTLGWVGIGFASDEKMTNLDMIIAGVDRKKREYIHDTHANEKGSLELDETQDVELLVAFENKTHTTIAVRRNVISGNDEDLTIEVGHIHIVWSYGARDLRKFPNGLDLNFNRSGSRVLQLIPYMQAGNNDHGTNRTEGVVSKPKMQRNVNPQMENNDRDSNAGNSSLSSKRQKEIAKHFSEAIILKSGSELYHKMNKSDITNTEIRNETEEEDMTNLNNSPKPTQMPSMSGVVGGLEKSIPKLPELPKAMWLDKPQTVLLKWVAEEENVIFELCAPTTGWIGLGFSPAGTMEKSDIIIMGIKENAYAIDASAKRNGVPRVDLSQDIHIMRHEENGTHTKVMIRRKTNTGDKRDTQIKDEPTTVIWAYGENDISTSPRGSDYHNDAKGSTVINFFEAGNEVEGGVHLDYKGFIVAAAAATFLLAFYKFKS